MRLILWFTVAVFLAGCGGSPVSPSPVDVQLSLAYGQTVAVGTSGISVRFDSVVEDSRCPADAMCVWEGRAVVKVVVSAARTEVDVSLQSSPGSARAVEVGGVRVEWIQLEPYPYAGQPTEPGAYRLTLRLTRRG